MASSRQRSGQNVRYVLDNNNNNNNSNSGSSSSSKGGRSGGGGIGGMFFQMSSDARDYLATDNIAPTKLGPRTNEDDVSGTSRTHSSNSYKSSRTGSSLSYLGKFKASEEDSVEKDSANSDLKDGSWPFDESTFADSEQQTEQQECIEVEYKEPRYGKDPGECRVYAPHRTEPVARARTYVHGDIGSASNATANHGRHQRRRVGAAAARRPKRRGQSNRVRSSESWNTNRNDSGHSSTTGASSSRQFQWSEAKMAEELQKIAIVDMPMDEREDSEREIRRRYSSSTEDSSDSASLSSLHEAYKRLKEGGSDGFGSRDHQRLSLTGKTVGLETTLQPPVHHQRRSSRHPYVGGKTMGLDSDFESDTEERSRKNSRSSSHRGTSNPRGAPAAASPSKGSYADPLSMVSSYLTGDKSLLQPHGGSVTTASSSSFKDSAYKGEDANEESQRSENSSWWNLMQTTDKLSLQMQTSIAESIQLAIGGSGTRQANRDDDASYDVSQLVSARGRSRNDDQYEADNDLTDAEDDRCVNRLSSIGDGSSGTDYTAIAAALNPTQLVPENTPGAVRVPGISGRIVLPGDDDQSDNITTGTNHTTRTPQSNGSNPSRSIPLAAEISPDTDALVAERDALRRQLQQHEFQRRDSILVESVPLKNDLQKKVCFFVAFGLMWAVLLGGGIALGLVLTRNKKGGTSSAAVRGTNISDVPTFSPSYAPRSPRPTGGPTEHPSMPPSAAPTRSPAPTISPYPTADTCFVDIDIKCSVEDDFFTSCYDFFAVPPICQSRPFQMTFLYEGANCPLVHSPQPYFECRDYNGGPKSHADEQIYMIAFDADNGNEYFRGMVQQNETFVTVPDDFRFGSYMNVTVYNPNNVGLSGDGEVDHTRIVSFENMLQTLVFDTTCEHNFGFPIYSNMRLGSIRLVEFTNPLQGRITNFVDASLAIEISIPEEPRGHDQIELTSIISLSNVGSFLNATDVARGWVLTKGEKLSIPYAFVVDLTRRTRYSFVTNVIGQTLDGESECWDNVVLELII